MAQNVEVAYHTIVAKNRQTEGEKDVVLKDKLCGSASLSSKSTAEFQD